MESQRRDPRYLFAKTDFFLLSEKQKKYSNYFLNSAIYPAIKYQQEVKKIETKWANRQECAGQSLAKDLEELSLAHKQIELHENMQRVEINFMFAKVYGHFFEMLHDNLKGYLTGEKFSEYLTEFKNAIELNKEMNLECWNQEPVEQIKLKIAEFLK